MRFKIQIKFGRIRTALHEPPVRVPAGAEGEQAALGMVGIFRPNSRRVGINLP